LNFLALFHAIVENAIGAHVRVAHEDVEAHLSIAFLKLTKGTLDEGKANERSNNLHCWKIAYSKSTVSDRVGAT